MGEFPIVAAAAIIGIVNGIRLAKEEDKTGFVLFTCAIVTGIVFGLAGLFGLNLESGILAGLSSSGLYRVGEKFGGR